MQKMQWRVWAVVLLAMAVSACGGGRVGAMSAEQYNAAPLSVSIPQGTDNAAVVDAAEQAMLGREWRIVSKSGDEVVGHLAHRYYDATLTIRVEGSQAVLHSDAMYDGPKTEEPTPGVPYGWLENIKSDMESALAN